MDGIMTTKNKEDSLSYEEASRIFSYNPETGEIIWKVMFSTKNKVGDVAGGYDERGYLRLRVHGHNYRLHRLAWLLHYGRWPKGNIDHINGVRDDNRIANLREVGQQENAKNRALNKNNVSGTSGVYWFRPSNKWRAQIAVGRQYKSLGLYEKKEDAIKARKAAERKYGFHENHGRTQ
jgi:hypothetical protein